MDLAAASAASSAVTSAQAGTAVGVAVLKKALDIQSQSALQLLEALPQPQPVQYNNPPNVGGAVDTFA